MYVIHLAVFFFLVDSTAFLILLVVACSILKHYGQRWLLSLFYWIKKGLRIVEEDHFLLNLLLRLRRIMLKVKKFCHHLLKWDLSAIRLPSGVHPVWLIVCPVFSCLSFATKLTWHETSSFCFLVNNFKAISKNPFNTQDVFVLSVIVWNFTVGAWLIENWEPLCLAACVQIPPIYDSCFVAYKTMIDGLELNTTLVTPAGVNYH